MLVPGDDSPPYSVSSVKRNIMIRHNQGQNSHAKMLHQSSPVSSLFKLIRVERRCIPAMHQPAEKNGSLGGLLASSFGSSSTLLSEPPGPWRVANLLQLLVDAAAAEPNDIGAEWYSNAATIPGILRNAMSLTQ